MGCCAVVIKLKRHADDVVAFAGQQSATTESTPPDIATTTRVLRALGNISG
jgi:hypothetical protein